MSVEGRIAIAISRDASEPVRVSFSQPGDVTALLRGRTPEDALAIIPKIYALCATAQAHACVAALEAALGAEVMPETDGLRQCLTDMESLRENVLRIFLDWPKFIDEKPGSNDLRALMALVPRLKTACFGTVEPFSCRAVPAVDIDAARNVINTAEAIIEADVLGEPIADWLSRVRDGRFEAWTASGVTPAARLFAAVLAQGWEAAGNTSLVGLAPQTLEQLRAWLDRGYGLPALEQNITPETTMMTRHAGDAGLAWEASGLSCAALWQRLLSRLIAIAVLPARIDAALSSAAASVRRLSDAGSFGASEVDAARGTLVHAVRLSGGRISHYGIIPPTQWNFDQNGPAARALSTLDRELAISHPDLVLMIVNAIDPCVGVSVTVH